MPPPPGPGGSPPVCDVHFEPPPAAPDVRAVDSLHRADDELRQRLGRDDDRATLVRDDVTHAAPTAASSFSARKLVEYTPLRNSSLGGISAATSRVVAMPRSSSSPSARSERSIASGRVSSHAISFATSES